MDDTIIPSIDLYSRTNKETDMCATAMEEEEISNVLVGDVHLELDTDQINQVAESSSYVGYYLWGGLFFLPSFINHSCLPNACWMKIGEDALFVRAARHLREGDEVTVSYLRDCTVPIFQRAFLLQERGFRCSCPRCLFEASQKFMEIQAYRQWTCMKQMWGRYNRVELHQLIEFSCELIEKLEWGFKNVASLRNDEGKQQWLLCSFAQAYGISLPSRANEVWGGRDLETLIRAVHATIGASEQFLVTVWPVREHLRVEDVIGSMCVCLYGKQSSSSLREILGLQMEMLGVEMES
ncbi:hypothetical protein KP509_36G043000 [Ceratopteris richardii]|uniref:SET domain-containing protein n=1 Tax=Ceratopteris richardii TaxID=49495 RepID=A0A8T2QCD3_CERRI|nr:hypothetical protein KP509_36G043000 [Ceratopteris richardii]